MNSQPAVYVAAGVGKHVYMSLLASSQTYSRSRRLMGFRFFLRCVAGRFACHEPSTSTNADACRDGTVAAASPVERVVEP